VSCAGAATFEFELRCAIAEHIQTSQLLSQQWPHEHYYLFVDERCQVRPMYTLFFLSLRTGWLRPGGMGPSQHVRVRTLPLMIMDGPLHLVGRHCTCIVLSPGRCHIDLYPSAVMTTTWLGCTARSSSYAGWPVWRSAAASQHHSHGMTHVY
jgi:hypothetical protein